MSHELAPRSVDLPSVLAAWLGGKSERTKAEYLKSLSVFTTFLRVPTSGHAVEALFAMNRGEAAMKVETWRGQMLEKGLSSATVNLRIATTRSLVEAARRFGAVDWSLDVVNAKPEPRRDSRGCTWDEYERVLDAATSCRERALLLLLGDRALRRSEVASLTIDDVGVGEVFVLGKGRREREPLAVNARTAAALKCWIGERGTEPGSLFGVAAEQVAAIVVAAGKRVGVTLRCHGLRHAACTRALDLTNGDVRKVQQFARHRDPRTTLLYDDARKNHASEIAALVGG